MSFFIFIFFFFVCLWLFKLFLCDFGNFLSKFISTVYFISLSFLLFSLYYATYGETFISAIEISHLWKKIPLAPHVTWNQDITTKFIFNCVIVAMHSNKQNLSKMVNHLPRKSSRSSLELFFKFFFLTMTEILIFSKGAWRFYFIFFAELSENFFC